MNTELLKAHNAQQIEGQPQVTVTEGLSKKQKENQKYFSIYLTSLLVGVFICTVLEAIN